MGANDGNERHGALSAAGILGWVGDDGRRLDIKLQTSNSQQHRRKHAVDYCGDFGGGAGGSVPGERQAEKKGLIHRC
jgi:hypothetical protein